MLYIVCYIIRVARNSTQEDKEVTVKQFRKKTDIARKYGRVNLENGAVLYYDGSDLWSICDKYGNTVDTACKPEKLEYIFEE